MYSNETTKKQNIDYLLVNPPLTDPTSAYHSISYLIGSAIEAGYTGYSCVDANIESLNYLANEENVTSLLLRSSRLLKEIEGKRELTRGDELNYRYALRGVGFIANSVEKAIAILRDPNDFYNYKFYKQAVLVIKRWLDLLSIDGFPGQFDNFTFNSDVVSPLKVEDLTNLELINKITQPFNPYFSNKFQESLLTKSWDIVGISVNFTSQLPFALRMCKEIRNRHPNTFICLGGTEITDVVKYLKNKDMLWKIFASSNAIIAGEGESAFIEILNSVREQRQPFSGTPGILLKEELLTLNVRYEDLSTLPAPRYDIWDYEQYWSPEPIILYSPTRGCYWNKCTFCDYGLSTTSPTSPSRQRPIEFVIEELKEIGYFAQTFYFSVDAISPSYLRKISTAIDQADLDLQWSAEIRIEPKLARGLAEELKRGGCVALSFGYEAGSQRILDLLGKGVNLDVVPTVLQKLKQVGIGVQMMGFIGFPTERLEEAKTTYEFLIENETLWILAKIDNFLLLPGAIVAKHFAEFGVKYITPYAGDNIVRFFYWDDKAGNEKIEPSNNTLQDLRKQVQKFDFDRPFMGGIDTSHSILYFGKYGPLLIPHDYTATSITESTTYLTPLNAVEEFTSRNDLIKFHQKFKKNGISLNSKDILSWLNGVRERTTPISSNTGSILEIFPNGEFMEIKDIVLRE
ncbi:radical SAM protein [Anaerolineales bacterium HSG24]|nr:radical SAM protein [Anaerolineales bacterium HSG24]